MDEKREKLIRDTWGRFRASGLKWPAEMPRIKVPLPRKEPPDYTRPPQIESLTFEMERGRYEGEPMYRVVCEGVIVAMFRP